MYSDQVCMLITRTMFILSFNFVSKISLYFRGNMSASAHDVTAVVVA